MDILKFDDMLEFESIIADLQEEMRQILSTNLRSFMERARNENWNAERCIQKYNKTIEYIASQQKSHFDKMVQKDPMFIEIHGHVLVEQ